MFHIFSFFFSGMTQKLSQIKFSKPVIAIQLYPGLHTILAPKWSQKGTHFGVQFWTSEKGISLRICTMNEEIGGPKSDPFWAPFEVPKW